MDNSVVGISDSYLSEFITKLSWEIEAMYHHTVYGEDCPRRKNTEKRLQEFFRKEIEQGMIIILIV